MATPVEMIPARNSHPDRLGIRLGQAAGQSHNGAAPAGFHPAHLRPARGREGAYLGAIRAISRWFVETERANKNPAISGGVRNDPKSWEERARTGLDATSSGGDALFHLGRLAQHVAAALTVSMQFFPAAHSRASWRMQMNHADDLEFGASVPPCRSPTDGS